MLGRGDNLSWKSGLERNVERGRQRRPLVVRNENETWLGYEFPIQGFRKGLRSLIVCYLVAGAAISPLETKVTRMVEIEPGVDSLEMQGAIGSVHFIDIDLSFPVGVFIVHVNPAGGKVDMMSVEIVGSANSDEPIGGADDGFGSMVDNSLPNVLHIGGRDDVLTEFITGLQN